MVMKKTMVKAILAVGLSSVLVLSGCQNGEKTPSETTAADADASKQVTLKFMGILGGGSTNEDQSKVLEQANEMLADLLPNTKLELSMYSTAEYKQKWDLGIAAGETIDLAWSGFSIPFVEEVQKGSYLELDDLLAKYGQDIIKNVPASTLDMAKMNGKTYAVATDKDNFGLRLGAFMPKSVYEKYWDVEGAKSVFLNQQTPYRSITPEMYDYLETFLKKMKEDNALQAGFSPFVFAQLIQGTPLAGSTDAWTPNGPMIRLANKGQEWDLTVHDYYELPEVKLFYQKLAEFYTKGYMRKDMSTQQNPRDLENTSIDNSYTFWTHMYTDFSSGNNDSFVKDIPGSKVPFVQVRLEDDFRYNTLEASASVAIPVTSKNPERAMMLLNLLHSEKGKDLQNLLIYGIEGTHYKIVDDKNIEILDVSKPKYNNANFQFGSQKNIYDPTNSGLAGLITNYTKINQSAIVMPYLGFHFDTKAVTNELAQTKAVTSQYTKLLTSGALGDQWESTYNEMITKLKAAGMDKIVQEAQKQLDNFMKLKS
jgi:putative aldouronate transport system substrate-binding protein